MWRQAQFLKFHILGLFLDFGQFVHKMSVNKTFWQIIIIETSSLCGPSEKMDK